MSDYRDPFAPKYPTARQIARSTLVRLKDAAKLRGYCSGPLEPTYEAEILLVLEEEIARHGRQVRASWEEILKKERARMKGAVKCARTR